MKAWDMCCMFISVIGYTSGQSAEVVGHFNIPEQQRFCGNSRVLYVIPICHQTTPGIIMRRNQLRRNEFEFSHLECVIRLSNIPIVETGCSYAGQVYTRLKNSNSLVQWTLGTAEVSFNTALEVALPPTVAVFGGPINTIDKLLCKSLDVVEKSVPNIHLPPQVMYYETKQYFSSKFVRPVLKRADSVKQMGNSVLASKYTAFAADKLEDALNVADKYVDKYLPDADLETEEIQPSNDIEESAGKAIQTMHHADRFSRKLQRRLTKRTLAEAKALKDRSQESIHVLLYVAELIATDPKLAMEKARQLWITLSENEADHQARPTTLEQLIVMLTRESARRIVHFVNFTQYAVIQLPNTISKGIHVTTSQCLQLVESIIKTIHLDEMTISASNGAKVHARSLSAVLQEVNTFATVLLERLASILAGQIEQQKPIRVLPPQQQHQQHRVNHNTIHHHTPKSTALARNQNKITHRHTNTSFKNGSQL
ncbi:Lipid storage droplet-1 [Carabus blaptoides fortunei]